MTKPILVAVDESPRAAGVLAAAIKLAHTFDAPLVLCHVITLPTAPFTADGLPTGIDLQAELEAQGKKRLEAVALTIPADIQTRCVTMVDIPWDGICEAAKEQDASLIVLGSHGYSGIDRLLGTTAAKVVNHADRSVLVVREGWPQ